MEAHDTMPETDASSVADTASAGDDSSSSDSKDPVAPRVSTVSGKRKHKGGRQQSDSKTAAPVDTSAQALLLLIKSVQETSQASANRRGSVLDDSSTWDDVARRLQRQDGLSNQQTPTVNARKQEIAGLKNEIDSLKARVAYLQGQVSQEMNERESGEVRMKNCALREVVHEHQLSMASARSVISWLSANEWFVPAHCYIHLPKGLNERYQALRAVKPRQVRLARRYMIERSRHLDLNVAHDASEQFTKDNGDVCVVQFSLTQFSSAFSARDVYDAAAYYTACLEISLSDNAGQLTIREEDTDFGDPTILHNRFLTTIAEDVGVEGNVALFTHFDKEEDYGLVIGTFVDHDDQYPYQPATRLRHDTTVVFMISHERDHIVVRRFGYSLVHHNASLTVDRAVVQNMSESITRWSNAILAQMCARFDV